MVAKNKDQRESRLSRVKVQAPHLLLGMTTGPRSLRLLLSSERLCNPAQLSQMGSLGDRKTDTQANSCGRRF